MILRFDAKQNDFEWNMYIYEAKKKKEKKKKKKKKKDKRRYRMFHFNVVFLNKKRIQIRNLETELIGNVILAISQQFIDHVWR